MNLCGGFDAQDDLQQLINELEMVANYMAGSSIDQRNM